MQKPDKKNSMHILVWIVCIAAALLYFYKCPFDYFVGIPCPGCGMTRALFALARLDFAQAFSFHPLVLIPPVFAVCWGLERLCIVKFQERFRNSVLWSAAILFFLVYAIRLLSGSHIVHLHIKQSVLGRLFFGS